jgi:quercetin dioxygenase-like cupin family protein
MKVRGLRPAHVDARGAILDILAGVKIDAITIITSKKGSVRGNHYHKHTIQYTYLISGRLSYLTSVKSGKVVRRVLKPGDIVESPAGETHTFVALRDSMFLSLSRGPRRGIDYEKDTYRLAKPLA